VRARIAIAADSAAAAAQVVDNMSERSERGERIISTEGAFWRSVPRAGILVRLSGHPLWSLAPKY
jgi:hypothetical protein